ncbi:MAG: hypothetical protein COX80_01805 [Candidatus Magasanikbacteria bacterium CG_4_10_14_0_2_um_filter_33_14]|uniref:Uncharacterized protein n=1 Tax=Candidatus Magasanikbacteria bacterium CG_4_10_14_0_2_um_filter_33_14 TaxID=1974636 RepID=A0A2M7VB87_9BACT|nr:MAG: hypothetical protein COX80_01805 [Candidatus Magasanikbacteria bacterium CG_4_10_14_0_2_um_filter_33_14]
MKEKNKKEVKDWYISATHYLTSGFIIPFFVGLLAFVIIFYTAGEENFPKFVLPLSFLWLVSLWFGVIYSSKYLEKTYIIKNSDKIINLSTLYFLIIGILYRMYNFSLEVDYFIDFLFFFVAVLVFYFASKKYLKNNATN